MFWSFGGGSRRQRRLVKRGLFDMASCRIKKPRRSEIGRLYLFVQFHHYWSILSRVYSKHMELYELMSRLVSNDAATRVPRVCHATVSNMTSACVHSTAKPPTISHTFPSTFPPLMIMFNSSSEASMIGTVKPFHKRAGTLSPSASFFSSSPHHHVQPFGRIRIIYRPS